uniref:BPTI/Kunitz inhibitor domain-containing protein n=1 Tax=Amblyomma americanum TaxID=6943 RepID=A0A0C9SET6_AMBAM
MKNYVVMALFAVVLLDAVSAAVQLPEETDATCNQKPRPGKRCPEEKRRRMWYFNPTTEECSSFMYNGCGGNTNKFETKQMCDDICNPSTYDYEIYLKNIEKTGNTTEAFEPPPN